MPVSTIRCVREGRRRFALHGVQCRAVAIAFDLRCLGSGSGDEDSQKRSNSEKEWFAHPAVIGSCNPSEKWKS